MNGRIKDADTRYPATGPAEVVIVNPNEGAAERIKDVAGANVRSSWGRKRIEDWMKDAE